MSELLSFDEIPNNRFYQVDWIDGFSITYNRIWFPAILFKASEMITILVEYTQRPGKTGTRINGPFTHAFYTAKASKIISTPANLPQIVIDKIKEVTGQNPPKYKCN